MTFVSSGSTADRLVYWESEELLLVSNSIPSLLALNGASGVTTYPRYLRLFWTICLGLRRYQRDVPVSIGSVQLLYFDNLSWNGVEARVVAKPQPSRDFGDFDHYYAFLRESMHAIAANLAARERARPYRMLCTISSGYDSPTVAVLAGAEGCDEAICIDSARYGKPEDGAAIAKLLRFRPHVISRSDWRQVAFAEVPFLVGDNTTEWIPFQGATAWLEGRVLFTGVFGGVVWSKKSRDLGEDFVRRDTSGLSQSEFRLWQGYIHCPVPYWGGRQMRDLNRMALSRDLSPWDVPRDYSRPIPRRILETAGVPRDMFGMEKRATAFFMGEFSFSPGAQEDYLAWLRRHRGDWIRRGRIPPIQNPALDRWLTHKVAAIEDYCARFPYVWRLNRRQRVDWPLMMRRHLFPWAMEHAKKRYQTAKDFGNAQALLAR